MGCRSASGFDPISTQTNSTSSASAWITPSTRWAMLDASAVKNLVSKRRTRPGGVIARAIKNSPDGSGSNPASLKGFHSPSSFGAAPLVLRPRQRPVSSQASRIAAIANERARRRDLRTALHQIGFQRLRYGCGHRNAIVCLVDATAGKDEFAGHEHHLVVAFADQNFWGDGGAIDQDQRGGVCGAAIGMVIGFFLFRYSLAHFTPAARFCFLFVSPRFTVRDFVRQIRACAMPIAPRPRRP